MFLIESKGGAIACMILSLLSLGTWPAILTVLERQGRLPQHTYLDYSITNFLVVITIAFTLGQIGNSIRTCQILSLSFLRYVNYNELWTTSYINKSSHTILSSIYFSLVFIVSSFGLYSLNSRSICSIFFINFWLMKYALRIWFLSEGFLLRFDTEAYMLINFSHHYIKDNWCRTIALVFWWLWLVEYF